jgi:hypothetical protein
VNDTHTSFEICEDGLADAAYFRSVFDEAVALCVYLCKMYSLDPMGDGVIIGHFEGRRRGIASNHADPGHWFPRHGESMDSFREAVKKGMGAKSPAAAPSTASTPAATTPTSPSLIFKAGDTVQFTGGAVYTSSTAANPAHSRGASRCRVTQVSSGRRQPYHLVSEDGGGVHGWVGAVDVKAVGGAAPAAQAFEPYTVKVTANALYIHRGPGTNTAITGTITDKGVYTVVEESDGPGAAKWGRLKSGAGWIPLDQTVRR